LFDRHAFLEPRYQRLLYLVTLWHAANCRVVLVQLSSSSGQPCFVLHVMPDSSSQVNGANQAFKGQVSRAGEGHGVQVFPGKVKEVAKVRCPGATLTCM
jgi:hypothetical protein